MNYKSDIKRLEIELQQAKNKQYNLEKDCEHKWGETKYDNLSKL